MKAPLIAAALVIAAAGVLTILAALIGAGLQYLNHQHVDLPVLGAAVTTGVGLIKAADGKSS
jgi:hypothetical protein